MYHSIDDTAVVVISNGPEFFNHHFHPNMMFELKLLHMRFLDKNGKFFYYSIGWQPHRDVLSCASRMHEWTYEIIRYYFSFIFDTCLCVYTIKCECIYPFLSTNMRRSVSITIEYESRKLYINADRTYVCFNDWGLFIAFENSLCLF